MLYLRAMRRNLAMKKPPHRLLAKKIVRSFQLAEKQYLRHNKPSKISYEQKHHALCL